MKWYEIIKSIEKLLRERKLESYQRFTELRELDVLMRKYFPNIVDDPKLLLQRDKKEFKAKLERMMHKKLNGAEDSIVNNFYQIIESQKNL